MDRALEELLAELPAPRTSASVASIVKLARARGVQLSRDDLFQLTRDGRDGIFVCPSFTCDFLRSYIERRGPRPEAMLELWADGGFLLPPLAASFSPRRAIGVVANRPDRELAQVLGAGDKINWTRATVLAFLEQAEPALDVIVGVPPWNWQPCAVTLQSAAGPVTVLDDPANAAVLKASTLLHPHGVGLFIVGAGFVMRPGKHTAFASLACFDLHLESLIELPRGIFSPDSGTGRFVLALSRQAPPAPVVGKLTSDPQNQADLLASLPSNGGERGNE